VAAQATLDLRRSTSRRLRLLMTSSPRFANALSTHPDSARAEAEVLETLRAGLDGATPHLLVVFVTHHYGAAIEGLGGRLASALGSPAVLGCTGVHVIGGSREVEDGPGMSVWAASLPGTTVRSFDCSAVSGADGGVLFSEDPPIDDAARASLLLLGDPYTFPMDQFLAQLNESHPGVPAFGGMSSGGQGPGQNLLLGTDHVRDSGLIGVVLEGDIEVRSVVSQGCRPVGKPWVITKGKENLMQQLGGQAAVDVLMETIRDLPPADQELFRRGPFVGLAIDATKSNFERADFLVRQILGMHTQSRSVAVADMIRRGQTVQFLVRDAAAAGEDLSELMRTEAGGPVSDPHEAGALLFSCNGRGSRMFAEPNHDVARVEAGLAAGVPVAGFFAAGEVGPVGGHNFLHGFTASVAVFRARAK